MKSENMTRRSAMTAMAGAAGMMIAAGKSAPAQPEKEKPAVKGRIRQSVSRWCYGKTDFDTLCKGVKAIGLVGIDLLDPADWPAIREHGLISTMNNGPGNIPLGWNDPRNHDRLTENTEARLREVAAAGWENMIVFSGNRRGMDDREGIKNCVKGLRRIMPLAEKLHVNVMMELLNSKRDHKDYMCDHTAWGVELAKELGSDRFKLLYDIYHMQIMEGDIINTIQENIAYIGHIHTGGVPGRNEIDGSQELNYERICKAIVDAGFKGYLAHEFVPARDDKLASLEEAFHICDV
jgi:hydroxypyruvate isomerase